ncbi:MAG TPA: GNAT family N-acetyltransferase [Thermoplasmata archaeon]|nr:GNAT family N-acetyltransferase [Thermoplasmata archaeon]
MDIDPDALQYEAFKETLRVRDFDSGSKDLDDFLNTEEVEAYEDEGLGRTTLVFYRGELVAYFTTSFDGLRVEYLKTWKSFTRLAEFKLEVVPAVKIGRLAVQRAWQSKGIGRHLIRWVAGMALELGGTSGVRLLIVQAKKESIPFYEKCGFQLTVETKRERKRENNRTMFFDLHSIADVA